MAKHRPWISLRQRLERRLHGLPALNIPAFIILTLIISALIGPNVSFAQQSDTLLIHFDFNRSNLTPAAESTLDEYFSANKSRSASKSHAAIQAISLAGYCDNTGGERYNVSLSKDRALAVKEYLRKIGVDATTIGSVDWFGKQYPLNNNSTSADRAMNRRVQIVIQKAAPQQATTPPPPAPTPAPIAIPVNPAPGDSATPLPPVRRSVYEELKDTSTHVGTSIILRNVTFYGDQHNPVPLSYEVLEGLLRALQENSRLRIHIAGYVCCLPDSLDGWDMENGKPLSVERAKFVYGYLLRNGISKDRMTFAGYGASHKIYPEEANPLEQALNRRVEIRILAR